MTSVPWFKFYPSDWLAGTRGLTATESGVFVRLVADAMLACCDTVEMPEGYFRQCGLRNWASLNRVLDALEREGLVAPLGRSVTVLILQDWRALGGREQISASVRREVEARDHACRYCGATDGPFHIDHVHPVALGGSNDPANLVKACAECNLSKGSKTLGEWRQ